MEMQKLKSFKTKTVRNVKSSTEPVEVSLYKIGKYALLSNQMIGYFPISTSNVSNKNRYIFYNFFSVPSFVSLFFIIVQIFLDWQWLKQQKALQNSIKSAKQTELKTIQMVGALISVFTIGQRLGALLFRNKLITFWENFCNHLHEISSSDSNFWISIDPDAKYNKIFLKSQRFIKLTVISNCVLVIISFILYFEFYFMQLPGFIDPRTKYIATFIIVLWNIMGILHVFISLFLTLPVQTINDCLEMIIEEIKELSSPNLDKENLEKSFILQEMIKSRFYERKVEKLTMDERHLNICIENYYRICDLVKFYEKQIGYRVFIELAYNSLIILSLGFMTQSWLTTGNWRGGLSRAIPIFLSLKILYHLGTDLGKLEILQEKFAEQLCRIPHYVLGDEMRFKVKFLVYEIANNPLAIHPGSYFKVNRRLVISILYTIVTFFIILIEFRDSEK